MNWYRRSAQQSLFEFHDAPGVQAKSPELYHSAHSLETLSSLLAEGLGYLGIQFGLEKYGYKHKEIPRPGRMPVFVVRTGEGVYVADKFRGDDTSPSPVEEWLARETDPEVSKSVRAAARKV